MFSFLKHRDPENHYDTTDVTIQVHAVFLNDILEAFERFLRACGFIFKGHIGIIEDEIDEEVEE